MDTSWRALQIDYNRRARWRLAEVSGVRFWGWEIVMMFYDIVITVDGYAEMMGKPAPRSHRERRALVERHLPYMVDPYEELYSLSLEGRYYKGYAMTKKAWHEAARCHEILVRNIPAQ